MNVAAALGLRGGASLSLDDAGQTSLQPSSKRCELAEELNGPAEVAMA